jgi:hypothetical protein
MLKIIIFAEKNARKNDRSIGFLNIAIVFFADIFWGSATPCASPSPWQSIFSNYSFRAHHPVVNQDDWHLDAMITIFCDFCQFSAKKIGSFLNI